MNAKTIIRKVKDKENPYAQIAKSAAQDNRLSWKATGILSYILSLPDDWQIYVKDLAKRKKDGISATRSALRELIGAGYIEKTSIRNGKGQFVKHEYLVHESPLATIHKSTYGLVDATKETTTLSPETKIISGTGVKTLVGKPKQIRTIKEYQNDLSSPYSSPAEERQKRIQEVGA